MGNIILEPARLSGLIQAPASKSLAHRAVICAALAGGESLIRNFEWSDDLRATVNAMETFGASFAFDGGVLSARGFTAGKTDDAQRTADCSESGSTLRFLIPVALALGGTTRFLGRGRLGSRPLDEYRELFAARGVEWTKTPGDGLDLTVSGRLSPGRFALRGDVSSQFVTGLLLALPLLDGDSEIVLTTHIESERYIDLTLSVMRDFGVEVGREGRGHFLIKGAQRYQSRVFSVEGDYSQAAFFLAMGALGCRVRVTGLNPSSLQGDRAILDILGEMGADVTVSGDTVEAYCERPSGARVDVSGCPDLVPPVAAAAAMARGRTEIVGAARLRLKESDRLHALACGFSKLGAAIGERSDSLVIEGAERLRGGAEVSSFGDHRIAMALAAASVGCIEPITLQNYECVSKSYPGFFRDFARLGGRFHEQHLG